ncbi:MAG TPA: amidohydrolase family protein [Bacteroidia bacterium]|nr:amidohydrolase family protein [Bacteroidia bacterium]
MSYFNSKLQMHIPYKLFIFSLWVLISSDMLAQGVPASPALAQNKSILLKGGIVHTGTGQVIQNGAVAFTLGKITQVTNLDIHKVNEGEYDEVIDVSGKHIYPGFIAPNSTLGLREVDAIRPTRDFSETGTFNPNVRSIIAYNSESRIIPTLKNNGVLLAQITPRYGLVTGTSSIVELDGWDWEDALYKENDGVHLNWPNMFSTKGWWAEPGPTEKSTEYEKKVNELKAFFSDAKAYSEVDMPKQKNLKLEAMRGLFNGQQKLYINADYVKEIMQAINFARGLGIKNMVIIGGSDSWLIPEMLKENNVSVIVTRLHSLPVRPEDDVDQPYKLPFLLQQADILYCLNYEGDMEVMGTRNIGFTAGTAVAYGLTKEQALMAITLNTAKILGIDKTTGSIEIGKDASIFVSTGDALDMRTNNVEFAFIRGKKQDLDDHQKQLYKKFSAKYNVEK